MITMVMMSATPLIRHIASALQTRVPTGAMLARMGGG